MIVPIKLIFYFALLLFAFFSGVKYSDQVKSAVYWLFEEKEQEIDFPEIDENNNNKQINNDIDLPEEVDIIIEDEIIKKNDINIFEDQNQLNINKIPSDDQ